MTWTACLIAIPLACYVAASVAYGLQGQWAMCVVYSGYAWAQGGLWLLDRTLAK